MVNLYVNLSSKSHFKSTHPDPEENTPKPGCALFKCFGWKLWKWQWWTVLFWRSICCFLCVVFFVCLFFFCLKSLLLFYFIQSIYGQFLEELKMPRRISPLQDAIHHVITKTDKTSKLEVKYINPLKGRFNTYLDMLDLYDRSLF